MAGSRSDKIAAVARYMQGHTGIPSLTFDKSARAISAPLPYEIVTTTSAKLQHWTDAIHAAPHDRIAMAIRYDRMLDSVADSFVGIRLSHFVPLMKAHYDIHVDPRIKDGE